MTLRILIGHMKVCAGCPFSLVCITEDVSIRQCSECRRITIHGSMDEGETFGMMLVSAKPCDHLCPAAISSRIFCRHCVEETGEDGEVRSEPRRIDVFDKLIDSIQKLGEGHEGSMRLLADMVREDKLKLLFSVDEMMLYGEKLWIAYDLCHSNKKMFEDRIEVRDKNLREEVEAIVAARKEKEDE